MLEIKRFSGILDTDSGEDFILPTSHKYALNGRFYGTQAGMRFQNVKGNTLIPNADLPNTGVNETVGGYFDQQKLRIFYFNYNSGGKNGIYLYDIKAGTTTTLLQCLSGNCPTDILNFSLQELIVSVNIIYGDSQQGDILYFIDTLFRPTKINIDRALANGYGTYQRSYLDVIKEIPQIPPVARYENDNTVTVNNLNGQLFQFKVRDIFDDNDMSATSAWSVMPLPQGDGDPALSSDATVNAVIKIIIPTGAPNVNKLEILGTTSLGETWGDFFSIDILNKADLSIPDNDIYIYEFRNDRIYAPIDINESNQLFDFVPRTANTQEVLLTNILIYGGILENFTPVVPDIALTPDIFSSTDIRFGMLVVQGSNTFGASGNIHISVVGKGAIPNGGNNATVTANVSTTAGTITYTNTYTSSIPTTQDIITGLSLNAISLGFTVVSIDANNLVLSRASTGLNYFNILNEYGAVTILTDSVPSFDWANQESFAIVYMDAQGRSDGVFYKNTITAQTVTYNPTGQPVIRVDVSNRPPDWAFYYHIVRIPNPSKSRFEYWITDRAIQGTDPITKVNYAYLSIENLNAYIKNNPSTATQLSYTWIANDRVKIWENMQSAAFYSALNDFQIINSLKDPTINGVAYTGQFLQILLPSVSSGITIDGTASNQNFLIEFYTPTKSLAENSNIFYEFGRRYAIGNPTTSLRFHQGETQNQNTDGTGFARIIVYDGDAYMRGRTIYANNTVSYSPLLNTPISLSALGDGIIYLIGETFSQTFSSLDYTPQSNNGEVVSSNPAYSDTNEWLTANIAGQQFTLDGELILRVITPSTGNQLLFGILEVHPDNSTTIVYSHTFTGIVAAQILTIPISAVNYTVGVAESKLFFFIENIAMDASTLEVQFIGGFVNLTLPDSTYTVNIVDQNFSDFYPSAVNSNGRAWAIQPNIDETHIGTLVRYSLPYLPNTNINNVNRFYEQNSDQYDNAGGDIRRFKYRGSYMRVFQDRKCGEVPVFQNILTNTSGQTQIGQSENVINNIQYYAGEFGMGGQYSGLVSGKIQDYFVDPVRGYQVRVSQDGIQPISELYYGQYFIKSLLTPYNKTYTRIDGGTARILGFYDFFNEEYVCILQGGTNGSSTIASYVFSFNEKRNGYSSFFDYNQTEFGVCAEDVIYNWKNGLTYIHNNTTNYCQFFGVNYNLQIQLVFNTALMEKKTYESIAELCDDIMECPDIYTNVFTGNLQQQSSIPLESFTNLESMPSSAFLRNKNTSGGLTNAEALKGNYIVVTLQKTNAQKLVNLSGVYIKYIDSPLTPNK